MVKLRRVYEAVDSSHTSIMYNMANSFADKGWYKFNVEGSGVSGWVSKATFRDSIKKNKDAYITKGEIDLRETPSKNSDVVDTVPAGTSLILKDEKDTLDVSYSDKGMTISFKLSEKNDPHNTAEGNAWLKNNKGKDFIFKGNGIEGSIRFNISKNSSGKRELVVDDVMVGHDYNSNLTQFQKKIKADAPKEGRLTGKSAQPFEKPKPYTITNLATPTFQSYVKKTKDSIIKDIALALSEVIDLTGPKKERLYYIDYDEEFNRVDEGYITEADAGEGQKNISWKDADVQKAISDAIKGLKVNTSKTTDKELVFTYNGKNGSLHLQGYMLVLDTDTDDDIPATNYPVKDKNNLTLDSLLATVKTVFSRREAKEAKKESHRWDDDIQSDELPNNPHDLDAYYILKGYKDDYGHDVFEEFVGDENGYVFKNDAIKTAVNLRYDDPNSLYGVTELVDINYFIDNTFWDALDDGDIKIVWNSVDLSHSNVDMTPALPKEQNEESGNGEGDVQYPDDPTIDTSLVYQDVAKERFMDKLSKSLILAPKYKGECNCLGDCDQDSLIWIYLSPSFAIDQLSKIVLPLCISGRKVEMPIADIPDPDAVFDGDYSENALSEYDNAVQDYLLNDAPMSDIAVLDLDNADEVKAQVVDLINTMAGDYQKKRDGLSDSLDIDGESLLEESRYFIVPSDTDLSSDKKVKKLTPLGYTDLPIAQNELKELADSGRYNFDLKILDTNFSNNKEKWSLL